MKPRLPNLVGAAVCLAATFLLVQAGIVTLVAIFQK